MMCSWLLLLLFSLCNLCNVRGQPTSAPTWSNTIVRPEGSTLILTENQYIVSGEGIYLPTYQMHFRQEANGNLILFRSISGGQEQVFWETGVDNDEDDYYTILQGNGDLITWQGLREDPKEVVWKSATALGEGDFFVGLIPVVGGAIPTKFAIFRGTSPLDVDELEWTSEESGISYTYVPTAVPTIVTESPTITSLPSQSPTFITSMPSQSPTSNSQKPSVSPTLTISPTGATDSPSYQPTSPPTNLPSDQPSQHPSDSPTAKPTVAPTPQASMPPSAIPTSSGSQSPSTSALPTSEPTDAPSEKPSTSFMPSMSLSPTDAPTMNPSASPSSVPSLTPMPTETLSESPTSHPTITAMPTVTPTVAVARDCTGICKGTYPFGCATQQPNTVKYGCLPAGGCHYAETMGEKYPAGSNVCTFKVEGSGDGGSGGGGNGNTFPTPSPTYAEKEDCNGVCDGSFPFGCQEEIEGIVRYGCNSGGGCFYEDSHAAPYPPGAAVCTYKVVLPADAPGASDQPSATPSSAPTLVVEDCSGRCKGEYPFGCADFLPDIIKYACNSNGGCVYALNFEDSIGSDWCLYKLDTSSSPTITPTDDPDGGGNGSSAMSWKKPQQSQTFKTIIMATSMLVMMVAFVF